MMPTLLSLEALESDRAYVVQQLQEAREDVWGTVRSMWENRLAEIDEQIAALNVRQSNFASVALVFDGSPVVGSGDIRLDFAASALDAYQKIISLAVASSLTETLPGRGRLPGADQSRLFIRDLVHGSMGFLLEEMPAVQAEMIPTVLKEAVENSTRLMTTLSSADEAEFSRTLSSIQPRLVGAFQRFSKILSDASASTRILGDERRLALSVEDVVQLTRRLSEIEVTEEPETFTGILLGILPESLQFELLLDEDQRVLAGAITPELAIKYLTDDAFKEMLVPQHVHAQIKTVRTFRNGRLLREQLILESVEPVLGDDAQKRLT